MQAGVVRLLDDHLLPAQLHRWRLHTALYCRIECVYRARLLAEFAPDQHTIPPGGLNADCLAIVASRSVVVSDVPPYAVAGGNPAKVLRRRFSDEIVAALLEIAWWNWSAEKITRNLERIMAADIEALRAAT